MKGTDRRKDDADDGKHDLAAIDRLVQHADCDDPPDVPDESGKERRDKGEHKQERVVFISSIIVFH